MTLPFLACEPYVTKMCPYFASPSHMGQELGPVPVRCAYSKGGVRSPQSCGVTSQNATNQLTPHSHILLEYDKIIMLLDRHQYYQRDKSAVRKQAVLPNCQQ